MMLDIGCWMFWCHALRGIGYFDALRRACTELVVM